MNLTRKDLLRLAVEADADPRTVEDEAAHPERWREPAPNRSRDRIRKLLLERSADGAA